jgi:hypothetical protein
VSIRACFLHRLKRRSCGEPALAAGAAFRSVMVLTLSAEHLLDIALIKE